MAAERTYALTKIEAGDYLLPSNDAKTLWRIKRYWEDGSLERGGKIVVGWEWEALYYLHPFMAYIEYLPRDFLELHNWQTWVMGLPTRAAAIEEAITSTPRGD